MIEVTGLRSKKYSYLMDDNSKYKKAKGTNVCNKKKTYV